MSLETPTTKDINDILIAQLQASLNETIPLLPKSFLRVLAKTLAAVFTLLFKYGGFIFLQVFVRTATISDTTINGEILSPLKEWGRLKGVGDPTAATQAELSVTVTVENQTGTLPSGSQLLNSSNGVTYITIGDVLLDAPTVLATIRAVADQADGGGAGAIGNLGLGDIVSFANPLANVARDTVVASLIVTGANGESEDAYRQRIIDRFQKIPQGGALADYEQWGEEAAGIINIYPYTSDCPGQVDVFAEATEASSGSPDGIPTTAQLEAVLASIELDQNGLASRRPANALVNAFPINRLGFATTVVGLVVDNPAQVQSDITAGIDEYFREREPFIVGLTIPPRLDRVTRSGVAGLVEDIVSASGGIFSSVVVKLATVFLPSSTYSSESVSIASEETDVASFVWNDDGTKFFIVGASAVVFEYTVSVPFDFSSVFAYSGNSFDVSTQEAAPEGLMFNADGTKFFIVGAGAKVFEYTATIGFDLSSTVAFSGSSFDVSTQEAAPTSIDFNTDGTKFFIVGAGAKVFEYTATIGFDLSSTVAFSGNNFNIAQDTALACIRFTNSGRFFYVLGATTDKMYEYQMSVPFGFGTDVDFTGDSFNGTAQDTAPASFDFNTDKSKFFIAGDTNDEVFEYAIGAGELTIDVLTLGVGEKAKSTGVSYT